MIKLFAFAVFALSFASAARATEFDGKCAETAARDVKKALHRDKDVEIVSSEVEKGAPAIYQVVFKADGERSKLIVTFDREDCREGEVKEEPSGSWNDEGCPQKPAICFSKMVGIKRPRICSEKCERD
jgi:hypothetical protein